VRERLVMTIDVLYEDNHCLAVNKAAGMPSQGGAPGVVSLVDAAGAYLRTRYQKPGRAYVGLVHRLDQPVSGVILLAKTSKAAARLSDQFRSGAVEKVYWAIVEGRPGCDEGEWIDVLEKDGQVNRARVVPAARVAGKQASVTFRVLWRFGRYAKLELRPRTGRSHQLRAQLARRGLPILGDRKYGSKSPLRALDGGHRIALHARKLSFTHPIRREVISVLAPVPADWPESLREWKARWSDSRRPAEG
jgi:23S rRNA pseudouridine1911/1915/1917 synthase